MWQPMGSFNKLTHLKKAELLNPAFSVAPDFYLNQKKVKL